jgi:hypothetical protein
MARGAFTSGIRVANDIAAARKKESQASVPAAPVESKKRAADSDHGACSAAKHAAAAANVAPDQQQGAHTGYPMMAQMYPPQQFNWQPYGLHPLNRAQYAPPMPWNHGPMYMPSVAIPAQTAASTTNISMPSLPPGMSMPSLPSGAQGFMQYPPQPFMMYYNYPPPQ